MQFRQTINQLKELNQLRWNAFTWVGILLIIICGIKVTYGLENYMDILFWDESVYLTRGVNMFGSIPRDWGPAYSLWYKFLSFFISDKIELYYFNFKLTTILICIVLFLFLMACGVQQILAFLFAVLFLASFINLPLWPRVSHFCIIVLLTGLLIAKHQQTLLLKTITIAFALLICSYARPELFLAFLPLFMLSYILFFMKIKQSSTLERVQIAALSGLFVFMYIFFKTPLNGGDANRSIGVFLQHFAMNYSQWHHDDSIFWLDFWDIVRKNFTDSVSLATIIKSNPDLFIQHITSNCTNYFIQTGKIIFSFFAPIFTAKTHWLCLMVSLILFSIYFTLTKISQNKRLRFFTLLRANYFTLFVLFVFMAPPIFVCIYAYPREHYLILQVPFLLVCIGLIISSITVEIEKPIHKIIVIGVVCFFTIPVAEDFVYFNMFRREENLSNLKTLQYIKANFKSNDSIRVFDLEGGMTNLLPKNFTNYNHIYLKDREQISLSTFLLSHPFDIIYNTPTLHKINAVKNDSVLFDLLKSPEKYGYFNQKTGNFTPSILIRKRQ
ncbi:MAG: hypothetical protein R2807_10545 [Chitinophagales bacterium]